MRHWKTTALVLLMLLLVGTSPAWAAEEGGGGLQFEKQLTWPTILTSIIVFLILLFILAKTAWKPMLQGLQKREETIRKALDDAEAAHEKAKALIAEYEHRIDQAREEAQAIFEEARKDADAKRAEIERAAQGRADETVERAKREIDQLVSKAWDGLVRDAADIATQAAGKIIGRQLTEEGHADLVAGVVSEFSTSRAAPTTPPAGEGREGQGA